MKWCAVFSFLMVVTAVCALQAEDNMLSGDTMPAGVRKVKDIVIYPRHTG